MKPQIIHQPDLFTSPDDPYKVVPIDPKEAKPFILEIHYARRMPPISYAYGLIKGSDLLGIVTYGKPASHSLCVGICGHEWSDKVIELNRLCLLNNQQNEASRLVGGSLKLLPRPSIVVSYADTDQDHTGIIYQATNFLYTGTTIPRNEWYIEGLQSTHSRALGHIQTEGEMTGLAALKEMYGDRLKERPRSVKHRYIYFVGSRSDKRAMTQALRYAPVTYPKRANETQSSQSKHPTSTRRPTPTRLEKTSQTASTANSHDPRPIR